MKKRSLSIKFMALLLLLFLFIIVCGCNQGIFQREPGDSSNNILFALPGPIYYLEEGSHFLKGVEMALQEVNEEGLLDGRKIDVIVADDEGAFMKGVSLAQSFVKNKSIAAVIGHWHTHITLPASAIYEENELVLLSPVVSNVNLTRRGYGYVFRNIPGDDEIGRQMALFAREKGMERIVLFYADTPYGIGLANAFEETAGEVGLAVVDSLRGFVDRSDMFRALQRWEALGYEGIFVASSLEDATSFITGIRKVGVDKPILGGDGLDVGFIDALGNYAEGAIIATMFNPDIDRPVLRDFVNSFKKEYGVEPDIWGIQGYDSIKLLADAIQKGGSAEPAKIAATLHNMEQWEGLLDTFYFNERGEAEGIRIYQKEVKDGEFFYVNY